MATVARGTAKTVAYKLESVWGTPAGATGAKQLRRVTADFNPESESYESNELRTDRQVADWRKGVRSATGALNGELSSKTYADFMQSLVARNFTTAPTASSLTLTIAASGLNWTVTRAAGSYLTDGFQPGMVVRLSGALDAANVAKNLLILSVTATILTVRVLNGSALVAQSAIAASTCTAIGKTTFVPATGHTEDSYTIEEFYADIAQSEVYTGMKVGSMNVQLPATGLTTVDFSFMGKDLAQTGTTQYFTSPAAQGTDGIYASVSGVLTVAGVPVALVTSADFSVERAMENATVVGSNSIADIFSGRIRVTGNLSVYFQDGTFRDYFTSETPVALTMVLTEDNTAASDFISFVIPKVKLSTYAKSDNELGLTASVAFQALLNDVTTAGLPATTLSIQDSAA